MIKYKNLAELLADESRYTGDSIKVKREFIGCKSRLICNIICKLELGDICLSWIDTDGFTIVFDASTPTDTERVIKLLPQFEALAGCTCICIEKPAKNLICYRPIKW